MLCYRDKTFCPFYIECKKGFDCIDALSETVKETAKKIGLPICQHMEKPGCFESTKKKGRPAQIKEDPWWEEI